MMKEQKNAFSLDAESRKKRVLCTITIRSAAFLKRLLAQVMEVFTHKTTQEWVQVTVDWVE